MLGGLALTAPAGGQTRPAAVPSCPPSIAVTRSTNPVPGWTIDQTSRAAGQLESVGFYDGPVSEQAQLRPNGGRTRGQITTVEHRFVGNVKPIHMACAYKGTDLVLSRPLPASVRMCTITSDRMMPSATDDSIVCR